MTSTGYAVIDFQTTGLLPEHHHRVVELSVVHLDSAGRIEGSWETLIDPQRDLGSQDIHGIDSAEMKNAPVFAEIAGRLISLLAGRVIVAHNVGFELRFLAAEFGRLGHTLPIGPNDVLCTLRLSRFFLPGGGRSIVDCCDAYGIESENMHETLAEAIAVAKVFRAYLAQNVGVDIWSERSDRAASIVWPTIAESTVPWVSRSRGQRYERRFLEQAISGMPRLESSASADFREIDYLGMLDKALSDGFLSSHEADRLGAFAASLGIDNFARDILHRRYFMTLIASSWSDSTLTDSQRAEILSVARMLNIPTRLIWLAIQPKADAPVAGGADAAARVMRVRTQPNGSILTASHSQRLGSIAS